MNIKETTIPIIFKSIIDVIKASKKTGNIIPTIILIGVPKLGPCENVKSAVWSSNSRLSIKSSLFISNKDTFFCILPFIIMTESIIITAGGIGKRMQSDIPKQFIEVKGLPILMHTINQFYEYNSLIEIIVVLPQLHIDFWNKLLIKHNFTIKHKVVEGGKERFYSIKNGIKYANGDSIGIHDAVRPFVNQKVIKMAFQSVKQHNAVIPVVDLKESIRKVGKNLHSQSVDRSQFKIVQTPQCFSSELIKKAYLQDFSIEFTDDASVVEKMGHNIYLIKGNDENIKITTPMDLILAEVLCNK